MSDRKCFVCGFEVSPDDDLFKLFPFPRQLNLLRIWLRNLELPLHTRLTVTDRVCSLHFHISRLSENYLKPGAVPSVTLAKMPVPVDEGFNEIECDEHLGKQKQAIADLRQKSIEMMRIVGKYKIPKYIHEHVVYKTIQALEILDALSENQTQFTKLTLKRKESISTFVQLQKELEAVLRSGKDSQP